MLTPGQNALLVYINNRLKEPGRPLSFVDMKEAVKANSLRSVHQSISVLEKQGFIARRHGRLRDIEILRMPDTGPGVLTDTGPGVLTDTGPGVLTDDGPGMPATIDGDASAQPLPPVEVFGAGGQPSRRVLEMAADLAAVARARELVGGAVWPKLSERTRANILRSELDAIGVEWAASPAVIAKPEILPSIQALQMATEAVRRGYGLTQASRHPEIVAQAIELSILLTAFALVPAERDIATARPATAMESSRESQAASNPGDRLSHAGRHILVVDDVSDVLVSVTAFLVSAGFIVTTATDGDAALRLIATDPLIGVLVTDFVMPGLSGVDLIAQAMQLRPDLKTLLITGYPSADGLVDLPPGVAMLAKPFRRAALIERVSVLVGETRPARGLSDQMLSNAATESAYVIK